MLVECAYRKKTAYVHAQADCRGALAANTVRNRTRKRADKGIHHWQRQKEQSGNVGTKAVGVLKIERQDKLGCANANKHDEHAGKVDGEGRICKAATSSLDQGHGAFAGLWLNVRQRVEPHDKRDYADGQVDEEDALPGKACHQHAAEHGAAHHAEGHEGRENTHGTASFARRKRLGDDTHVVSHGRRATDALNNARQDKNLERGRKAAQQRTDRKDDDAQLKHIHLAAHVAQTAKRQHSHASRKQIHRAYQLNAIEAHAQLLLHHGQRHGHDGRIQTHHKRHDEHGKQNRPLVLAMGVAL